MKKAGFILNLGFKDICNIDSVFKFWIIMITIFSTILFVAIDPLSLLQQKVSINVTATGEKNPNSKSSEIWIEDFGGYINDLAIPRGWERKESKIVSYKNQPTTITWKGNLKRSFVIKLDKHSYSGIAEISVNGQTKRFDLFSDKPDSVSIRASEFIQFFNSSPKYQLKVILVNIITGVVFFLIYSYLFLVLVKNNLIGTSNIEFQSNTSYLGRLDHLRFLAASLVILYHYFHEYISKDFRTHNPLVGLISQGHTGVGLFMILSGLIFGIIGYNKKVDYWGFLYNRIVRIYPLYIFALFIVYSVHRTDFSNTDIFCSLFPFLNPAKLTALPLFGHLWTIGVEFQFYIIFPFVNLFILKYGQRYIYHLILLSIFFKEFYFINTGFARDIAYWTILGRIDQFLIGILFAHFYKKNNKILSNPIHMLFSTLGVVSVMFWFNIKGGYFQAAFSHFWVFWPIIEGGFWGYFGISYINCSLKLPNLLEGALAKLGAMSFSMYIMHYMIIPLIMAKVGVISLVTSQVANVIITGLIIIIPSICLLSFFTYNLIEKPFLGFKKKYVFDFIN